MKVKKIMVMIMAITLLAAGFMASDKTARAEGSPTVVVSDDNYSMIVKPGETTHVKLPIKAVGANIINPTIEIVRDDKNLFTYSAPQVTIANIPILAISTTETSYLEFDVKASESAGIGVYPLSVKFTYDTMDEGDRTITLNTSLEITEEKVPPQLTINSVEFNNALIGSDTNLSFTVKNEGEISARGVYLNINYGDTGIVEGYTVKSIKIGDLDAGASKKITLPVEITSAATAGKKTLKADFTYKTKEGVSVPVSYNFYVNVLANQAGPKLSVAGMTDPGSIKPGTNFNLTVSIANSGEELAKNVSVAVDSSSISKDGVLTNYYSDGIKAANIAADGKRSVDIPLTISKYATGGLKEVKLNLTCTDDKGVPYNYTGTVYIDVIGEVSTGSANIVISGVTQSPEKPAAGERMEVSFYLENKSTVDVSELKIYLDNLTGNTFIPVDSAPYQYFETLKGGDKIKVSIPLTLSGSIPEGLNNLQLHYTYSGMSGGDGTPVTIPIHDVQNDLGSNSKPKLIVSKYYTDIEELKAGSTFKFTFDIYNTNASVAAKNITVTATQADNIFTVTQGSNSFFINKIDPGETVTNTLELKVKSDASTKAYPIKVTIEYEYDGIKPNPTTGEIGETKSEELNLMVIENSRPVVDNIAVSTFDGNVVVNNPATLGFEFYNMGKSQLNNVVATVEGDFTKSDGSMYFIGNVAPGSSAYGEFEVIPNVEGNAKGVIKISFEDSNGDPIEISKDFESMVNPAQVVDPGMVDGGSGEVFNPTAPTAKKAIVPIWLFVIIQLVIFAVFVPVTRKVIISVYKSKLRKKEEENY